MPGAEEKLWPEEQRDSGVWGHRPQPYNFFFIFCFSYRSMFSFGKSAENGSNDLKAVEWSWKFVKLHLLNFNC